MSVAPDFTPRCPNHADVTADLRTCSRCGHDFCPDCVVELDGHLACAGCKEEVLRDLRSGSGGLEVAGLGRRFLGSVVDGLVFGIPSMVALFVYFFTKGPRDQPPEMALLVLTGVLTIGSCCYDALMTAARGQTLGKMVAGIKVVTPEGEDVTARQAWIRAGSRVVMALTRVLGVVDALYIFSENKRTLHDRLARTVVVNCQ